MIAQNIYVYIIVYDLILFARRVFVSYSLLSLLSLSPRVLFPYDLFLFMVDPSEVYLVATHPPRSQQVVLCRDISNIVRDLLGIISLSLPKESLGVQTQGLQPCRVW